jgi:hypothetical protein
MCNDYVKLLIERTTSAGTTAAENSVEGTHQEKKFSENNKISRAKSKNSKRLPVLRQGGTQANNPGS